MRIRIEAGGGADVVDRGTLWQIRLGALVVFGIGVHGWLRPDPRDADHPLTLILVGIGFFAFGELVRLWPWPFRRRADAESGEPANGGSVSAVRDV